MHLLLTHALLDGQSVLITHSGRQPSYGLPMYPSMQVHDPALCFSLHIAFAPHGVGEHGVEKASICKIWRVHSKKGSPVNPIAHRQIGE